MLELLGAFVFVVGALFLTTRKPIEGPHLPVDPQQRAHALANHCLTQIKQELVGSRAELMDGEVHYRSPRSPRLRRLAVRQDRLWRLGEEEIPLAELGPDGIVAWQELPGAALAVSIQCHSGTCRHRLEARIQLAQIGLLRDQEAVV